MPQKGYWMPAKVYTGHVTLSVAHELPYGCLSVAKFGNLSCHPSGYTFAGGPALANAK